MPVTFKDKTFIVSKINLKTAKHEQYFSFILPLPTEKDFYRQTVSFNAFFRGMKNRNRNGLHLYHAKSLTDLCGDPTPSRVTCCGDLWGFYKAIGFDYKSKKYVEPSPRLRTRT